MPKNHFLPQGFTPGPIQGEYPQRPLKSAYSIKCLRNAPGSDCLWVIETFSSVSSQLLSLILLFHCDHTFTFCMLGNISCFCCCVLTFFNIKIFKKFFQEQYQSVKRFESRSGPTYCRTWSGSKLFAKVISWRQNSLITRKKFNKLKSPVCVLTNSCAITKARSWARFCL